MLKNAIISIVFNQKLVFLVNIFSKLHENTLTVSLKFLQDNIIIRNTLLAAKMIVALSFTWKYGLYFLEIFKL